MRIAYCDRCGFKHEEGLKGRRVVRVQFSPMSRAVDLCGSCRSDFQGFLDMFLRDRDTPKTRHPRADVEEALWCLKDDPPIKKQRPDTAEFFLRRALRNWGEAA